MIDLIMQRLPQTLWGVGVFYALSVRIAVPPFSSSFPGLPISLTILAINFMGDALCDALDPRQR